MPQHDAIIIGTGQAGPSLARSLAAHRMLNEQVGHMLNQKQTAPIAAPCYITWRRGNINIKQN
jgi:predicted dinucleotide-binding enzyme